MENIHVATIIQHFLHFEIGLLTILNPIAAAVIMVSLLNQPTDKQEIEMVSKKTSTTVLIASFIVVLFGDMALKLFGINVYSIKVIGGIVLLLISIKMIQGQFIETTRHSKAEQKEAIEKEDISIIPLAIPILVGPGTMATLLVFRIKAQNIVELITLIVAVVIATIIVYFTLKNAVYLTKILKITGLKIITRIMGLVVGAIASQFIISGIKSLWNMY